MNDDDKITYLHQKRQPKAANLSVESKEAALAGLIRIAEIATRAAADLETGMLTLSPMDLMQKFSEELKMLEQFREDEVREILPSR
ncbi:MAG: hypothetical protein ACO1RX_09000 [Candidatus Sericytochromatia bacterium]